MAPFISTMILINPNTAAIHPSFVNSAPGDTDLSFVGPSQILYSNDDVFKCSISALFLYGESSKSARHIGCKISDGKIHTYVS